MNRAQQVHRLPFVHGYANQLDGKGFLDNPYVQDSDDFRVWIDGYVQSMQDNRLVLLSGAAAAADQEAGGFSGHVFA